mgnify:CR=1 FL=1
MDPAMSSDEPSAPSRGASPDQSSVQAELDRRTHHLRTLYDMSEDMFALLAVEEVLRHFLLMTIGNFGVVEGFALTRPRDVSSQEAPRFVSVGFEEGEAERLVDAALRWLEAWNGEELLICRDSGSDLGTLPPGVETVLPFRLNDTHHGILALGPKITGEPYGPEDRELIRALNNHLLLALKNALSFEDIRRLNVDMQAKNTQLKQAYQNLDRRVYHLKTLYDVSRDIFGSVDTQEILKSFLMMTMGNFGVVEAFLLTLEDPSCEVRHEIAVGYTEERLASFQKAAESALQDTKGCSDTTEVTGLTDEDVACALRFRFADDAVGLLGLGHKLVGEPYTDEDLELLTTLVNNLVIALKNAASFEDIKRLNRELRDKNEQLEATLQELQAALRKVEILESIKSNLSKFLPTTVTRLIESSPKDSFDARERDVSVMFVDIEGYTALTEKLGAMEVNALVEQYFSVFMDAIYENNGDVVETSGDGLMILFMAEDETSNALEAVRSSLMIMAKTCLEQEVCRAGRQPLKINIGISSGNAAVGANKFECYTGSRWTYTCHGTTINVAARICSHATGGEIMVSRATADRVKGHFPMVSRGCVSLKNLSDPVEIFLVASG